MATDLNRDEEQRESVYQSNGTYARLPSVKKVHIPAIATANGISAQSAS
jgi:hypothetical protein